MARVRTRKRWGLRVASALLLLLLVGVAAARLELTLIAPHAAFAPTATLSDDRKKELDEAIADAMLTDRERALDLSLDVTGRWLTLAPWHKTSLEMGRGARGGNGTEYAELFATVFDVAAKRAGSTARAYRVESDARVLGEKIPLASLARHDWVLVVDAADGARIALDPMLADAWLGASLARNVRGGDAIPLPK
jgi:hypothetical protein